MTQITPKKSIVERITRAVGSVASLVIHTLIFIAAFAAGSLGYFSWELVLLVLTTALSLEAIYLAILIQITVNRNTESLEDVEENIDDIQENVDEIQEDIDEVQEDIGEIQEDIDEVQEDITEISEDEYVEALGALDHDATLRRVSETLQQLIQDVEMLKKK